MGFFSFGKARKHFKARLAAIETQERWESAWASLVGNKFEPNKDDYEIVGVKDALFIWQTDDGTDNSVDDASNSSLDLDKFDVTSRHDSAWIRVINSSGNSKTVRGALIRGKPVIRLSGDNGFIHDDFVDYEDIYRNGEKKFELGNNYICTKAQTESLADFHWKNFRAKRHIFALSMVGTRYQFSPGEWYTIQIGGAAEQEHIDAVCECYNVQIERGVGELGTTVVTFREVYEGWAKDSNSLARIIAGGNPYNMPNFGRRLVASSTYLYTADYYCSGASDETEINAAISELAGIGGGFVELTEGTFITDGVITLADNIMLAGKGWNTSIEKNGAYDGISLIGSNGSEYTNLCLQDFRITRNASDTNNNPLINLEYCDKSTMRNVFFDDGYYFGIELDDCDDFAVIDSLFDSCGNNSMDINGASTRGQITNNRISAGSQNGILCYIDYVSINGNVIENSAGSITLYGASNCSIVGNVIYNSVNGIFLTTDSDNNIISGNISEGNSIYGIRIATDTCDINVVTGNRATNNTSANFSDAGTGTVDIGNDWT